MTKPIEPARLEILTAAANGNAAALAFLMTFAERAHWLDDVVDGEVKPDIRDPLRNNPFADNVATMEERWLMCLTTNSFFLANRGALVPAMVLALNAWMASENIKQPVEKAVVKGQWHEVVWLVAWLTGGWSKLGAVSSTYRKYDVEEAEEEYKSDFTCSHCKAQWHDSLIGRVIRENRVYCSWECSNAAKAGYKIKEANGMPGR